MKKGTLFFIAIVLLLFMISGCAQSSKTVLEEALTKTEKIQSQQTSVEMKFNMDDISSDNLETQMMAGLLQNSSVKVDTKVEGEKSQSNMKLSMAGFITVEGVTYTDGDKVAMKYPFINNLWGIGDRYILYNTKDVSPEQNNEMQMIQDEQMIEFNKLSRKALIDQIDEKQIVINKGVELETPNEVVKGTEYVITLPKDKASSFVKQILLDSLNNDITKDMTIELLMQQATSRDINLTQEEIKNNSSEAINKFLKASNMEVDLKMSFILDNKNYIRGANTVVAISILDSETQQTTNLSVNIHQKSWDINQKLDIDIPDFNDENSISIEEINNTLPNKDVELDEQNPEDIKENTKEENDSSQNKESKSTSEPNKTQSSNQVDIKLYFMNQYIVETGNGDYNDMVTEVRSVKKDGRAIEQIILEELKKGPRVANAQSMFTKDLTIRSVTVKDGIAYVDLSSENLYGASIQEIGITQQIIYSLTELGNIDKVQFLVDGAVRESLMGHGDISYPLGRF